MTGPGPAALLHLPLCFLSTGHFDGEFTVYSLRQEKTVYTNSSLALRGDFQTILLTEEYHPFTFSATNIEMRTNREFGFSIQNKNIRFFF